MNNNKEKDQSREKIIQIVDRLISFNIHFYLYGPKGSGKTFIIKSLLNKYNRQYILINCIIATSKISFLKLFAANLLIQSEQTDYKYDNLMVPSNKVDEVTKIIKEQLKENEKYILFLDNVQSFHVPPRATKILLRMFQQKNSQLIIIMAGTAIENPDLNFASSFINIPRIYLPSPSEKQFYSIMKEKLTYYGAKMQGKHFQTFLNDFTRTFHCFTSDIDDLIKRGVVLIEYVIESINISKNRYSIDVNDVINKKMIYKKNKQVLFKTKQINLKTFSFDQKKRVGKVMRNVNQHYLGLLRTASYVSACIAQINDARSFQRKKRFKTRKKQIKQYKTNQKIDLLRTISIADALPISFQRRTQQCQEQQDQLWWHSTDFLSCISLMLLNKQIIKVGTKISSLGFPKLSQHIGMQHVDDFEKKNNFKLKDYFPIS